MRVIEQLLRFMGWWLRTVESALAYLGGHPFPQEDLRGGG